MAADGDLPDAAFQARGYARADALVSVAWLESHLYDPDVRVLDGSFFAPGAARNAEAGFEEAHIPGALFFDVDGVCDRANPLPHMLPPPEAFAAAASALGIGPGTRVLAYDQPGSQAAPRAWWIFRVFGHERVAVLDGGLGAWLAAGLPASRRVAEPVPAAFSARLDARLVRTAEAILSALAVGSAQVVDVRPAARFSGAAPEPRPARHRGHIPGARNLPYAAFTDPDRHGQWRDAAETTRLFAAAGVDLDRPLIASCGSGVTACSAAFAAFLLGRETVAVYDGSWAEWGNRDDVPIERSAAAADGEPQ